MDDYLKLLIEQLGHKDRIIEHQAEIIKHLLDILNRLSPMPEPKELKLK